MNIFYEKAEFAEDVEDAEFTLDDAIDEITMLCKTLDIPLPAWVAQAKVTLDELTSAFKNLPPEDGEDDDDDDDFDDEEDEELPPDFTTETSPEFPSLVPHFLVRHFGTNNLITANSLKNWWTS